MAYVNTTFLPKTNGLVFGDRLEARSNKGRVFLMDPTPTDPAVVITQGLQPIYDIEPSVRVTLACGATGVFDLTYTWQFRKADNSSWITANTNNLANEYPDVMPLIFEPARQSEPAQSSFQINIVQGVGPTQFRCRIRDTSPEGTNAQKVLTTTLNYI